MAFSFSSCDSSESGVVIKQPVIVAVEENSSEYLAAYDYATSKGYELVEYATRQAAKMEGCQDVVEDLGL